jgi:hypothetical protein
LATPYLSGGSGARSRRITMELHDDKIGLCPRYRGQGWACRPCRFKIGDVLQMIVDLPTGVLVDL